MPWGCSNDMHALICMRMQYGLSTLSGIYAGHVCGLGVHVIVHIQWHPQAYKSHVHAALYANLKNPRQAMYSGVHC